MAELRTHQKSALARLGIGKILTGGVGSGKSMVAVAYYAKMKSKKPVIVITTAKKRDSLDWEREFARFAIGTTSTSTVAGVLTVDSWNNIHKYEDRTDAFFIFDEQRVVGSGGWVKSFLKIAKNNHWIMLSATPGDNWLDYIPVFLANGFYKNRTEFKANHVIYKSYTRFPAVDRYVNVGKLVRLRDQILVQMPFERHTKRHTIEMPVSHDEELMKVVMKQRWDPYAEEPIKNAPGLYYLMRKVVNSDPSRLERLRSVMEKHPRLIVFYNFNYELEILRGIQGIEIAEWNGHKHHEIPSGDRWLYLVQYTSGAEGWECIATNATFFWSQNPSYKRVEQAYGRVDRLNTPYTDLFYYLPMSNSYIDKAMRRAFCEKRDFNESDLSDVSGSW